MSESSDRTGSEGTNSEALDPPEGVDETLIDWMLDKSPTERLLAVQQQANAILSVREQNDSD
ncbi:MAG: hypothetical protein ABEL76_14480 [Bradymonadaceae bacterium]